MCVCVCVCEWAMSLYAHTHTQIYIYTYIHIHTQGDVRKKHTFSRIASFCRCSSVLTAVWYKFSKVISESVTNPQKSVPWSPKYVWERAPGAWVQGDKKPGGGGTRLVFGYKASAVHCYCRFFYQIFFLQKTHLVFGYKVCQQRRALFARQRVELHRMVNSRVPTRVCQ